MVEFVAITADVPGLVRVAGSVAFLPMLSYPGGGGRTALTPNRSYIDKIEYKKNEIRQITQEKMKGFKHLPGVPIGL